MATIWLQLDHSTNTLINPGTTEVLPGETIDWEIVPGENIEHFNISHKHLLPHHPFTRRPPGAPHPTLTLDVRPDIDHDINWGYSIHYTISSPHETKRCDPIIAVKPVRDFNLIAKAVRLLITAAVFIGVVLWLDNRNKRRS